MDIEGIKELPEAPAVVEHLATQEVVAPASHKRGIGWLLGLLLAVAVAAGYFFFLR